MFVGIKIAPVPDFLVHFQTVMSWFYGFEVVWRSNGGACVVHRDWRSLPLQVHPEKAKPSIQTRKNIILHFFWKCISITKMFAAWILSRTKSCFRSLLVTLLARWKFCRLDEYVELENRCMKWNAHKIHIKVAVSASARFSPYHRL